MDITVGREKTHFAFLFIMSGLALILSHPQCLDDLPPFSENQGLQFCTEYSEFGCCAVSNEERIQEKYTSVIEELGATQTVSGRCQEFVKTLLCQQCSPYASHVYDTETPFQKIVFPGLCRDYCLSIYEDCIDVIRYFSTEASISPGMSGSEFCEYIKAADDFYCYPDILTNDELDEQVNIALENREGCLCVEELASNMEMPILGVHAGDGSHRFFIAEQKGIVHIFHENGTKVEEPFLDIAHKLAISDSRAQGDERGIMGLAFHPEFKKNGRIFVSYTNGTSDHAERQNGDRWKLTVSEMRISDENFNKVDPNFERILLVLEEPGKTHIDGQLLFGPGDGFLYIFLGDGGTPGRTSTGEKIAPLGDPWGFAGNGQNTSSLQGSVLRIDVNRKIDEHPYGIPSDNPYVNNTYDGLPEVYAHGFRSLWRSSIDRGDWKTGEGKGRIFCGDVGHQRFEEVNLVVKGGNYGWRAKEGYECQYTEQCTDGVLHEGDDVEPIHVYDHSIGKAIIGGYVYRGCEFPNLQGKYIFADYRGQLYMLTENKATGVWDHSALCMGDENICHNRLAGSYANYVLSFGENEAGELFVLSTTDIRHNIGGGRVYKLVDPSRRGNPEECENLKSEGFPHVVNVINRKVNPGEETSFTCSSHGGPIPKSHEIRLQRSGSATWVHPDDITTESSNQYVATFSGIAVNVDEQYNCSLSIPPFDSSALTMNVELYEPPRFSSTDSFSIVAEATSATISWGKWEESIDVGDGPVEAYRVYYKESGVNDWTWVQDIAVDDTQSVTHSATITGLQWSTRYDFTVTAKRPGPHGEGTNGDYLTATTRCDVPSIGPTITTVTSADPNGIHLTIQVPSDYDQIKCNYGGQEGYIDSFEIKYRPVNSEEDFTTIQRLDSTLREFQLDNLRFYTEYEISILFTNKDEKSPWSLTETQRTPEGAPSTPQEVTLIAGVDYIEVQWTIPHDVNGIIIEYRIRYWETGSSGEKKYGSVLTNNPQDNNAYQITGLENNQAYSVQVAAVTGGGQGYFSQETSIKTKSTARSMRIAEALPVSNVQTKPMLISGSFAVVSLPQLSPVMSISSDSALIDYIVVVEYEETSTERKKRALCTHELASYSDSIVPYYIAASFPLDSVPQTFTIGDGGMYGGYFNPPLTVGTKYHIYYGFETPGTEESVFNIDTRPRTSFTAGKSTEETTSISAELIYVISGVCIAFLVIIIAVLYCVRRSKVTRGRNQEPPILFTNVKGNGTVSLQDTELNPGTFTEKSCKENGAFSPTEKPSNY